MPEDSTNHKKRKMEYECSYSEMTPAAAEERLRINFQKLLSEAIPVSQMLAEAHLGIKSTSDIESTREDAIKRTKERVWGRIVEYLNIEGYPTEASPDFKRANVNDLILYIIGPILWDFNIVMDEDDILLRRQKELISTDSKTGGYGEFVLIDKVSWTKDMLILIIESKPSLGEAIKHCSLAMKDMWDNNAEGRVYGLVTTGEDWRMLSYDGSIFELTEGFAPLFTCTTDGSMGKDRWIKDLVLVDCIIAALRRRGLT